LELERTSSDIIAKLNSGFVKGIERFRRKYSMVPSRWEVIEVKEYKVTGSSSEPLRSLECNKKRKVKEQPVIDNTNIAYYTT
jgi:hypothetical protein